jgi:hypothetical protein
VTGDNPVEGFLITTRWRLGRDDDEPAGARSPTRASGRNDPDRSGADPGRAPRGHLDARAPAGRSVPPSEDAGRYKHSPNIDMIDDAQRLQLIARLISEGRQLVLAQGTAALFATAGAAMPTSCTTSSRGCASAASRGRTSRRCWARRPGGSWRSRRPLGGLGIEAAARRPDTAIVQADLWASWMARQTRSGVAGMSS